MYGHRLKNLHFNHGSAISVCVPHCQNQSNVLPLKNRRLCCTNGFVDHFGVTDEAGCGPYIGGNKARPHTGHQCPKLVARRPPTTPMRNKPEAKACQASAHLPSLNPLSLLPLPISIFFFSPVVYMHTLLALSFSYYVLQWPQKPSGISSGHCITIFYTCFRINIYYFLYLLM